MVELELLGLHSDGEHLVLTDSRGERYRVVIDDALRAAVRRDRPHLQHLHAEQGAALRPKDIQALVRAGATAQEIAEQHGLPVEHVRRYEGPVLAERAWVVQQAKAIRIDHDPDAPELGDTVVDRLATRGVRPGSLSWDAVRIQGQPWEVAVAFATDGEEKEARWRVDLSARSVRAVDDEARWLSETQVGPGPVPPRRRLSPVTDRHGEVFDQESGRPDQTESILDHLTESRGSRTRPDLDPDEEEAPTAPLWDEGAHPAASRPEDAFDAHILPLRGPRAASPDEAAGTVPALEADRPPDPHEDQPPDGVPGPRQRPRKQGRRSVPSWDEIVFGARPE